MTKRAFQAALASLFLTAAARSEQEPAHFSAPLQVLASMSDIVVVADVETEGEPAHGLVDVRVVEVWKGRADGLLRIVSSAPWMSRPWSPAKRERAVLFLNRRPDGPFRLLDSGFAYFRVVPFSQPVVEVWPGLLPGSLLSLKFCQSVSYLRPDGTLAYKTICTRGYSVPLSTLRDAFAKALPGTSGPAPSPPSPPAGP